MTKLTATIAEPKIIVKPLTVQQMTEEQRNLHMLGMPVDNIVAFERENGEVVKVASVNGNVVATKTESSPWPGLAVAAALAYFLF